MKCKKQMIQASLLAFGLSMGVGLTGAPSALAAPPSVTKVESKFTNTEVKKAEEQYMDIHKQWELTSLDFCKELYSKLSMMDICCLMLDNTDFKNMDTVNNIVEKVGNKLKLNQEIVRKFKDATAKMIEARNQFIDKLKNTLELKDYVKELNSEINKFKKSVNEKITWAINLDTEHEKTTELLMLQERKELENILNKISKGI